MPPRPSVVVTKSNPYKANGADDLVLSPHPPPFIYVLNQSHINQTQSPPLDVESRELKSEKGKTSPPKIQEISPQVRTPSGLEALGSPGPATVISFRFIISHYMDQ